jgi:hypothetical protein
MSESNNYYQISSEHTQLVDILKLMYNDNIRQINSMTNSINVIRQTNTQIRNTLIQILNRSNQRNNQRNNQENNQENNQTPNNFNRVFIHDIPYVIDHIQNYTIPVAANVNRNRNRNRNRNNTNRDSNGLRFYQNFFDPVEVYPTQSQIETATRNVQYCDILNPINRTCPISLEPFTDTDMVSIIRYCGHIFKPEELRTWFQTNYRCPMCRYDIRNYNPNNSANVSLFNEIDASNNFIQDDVISSQTNVNDTSMNHITSYLDVLFDNGLNTLNDTLINEYTNIMDNSDANALLTFLNSTIRRR